MEISDQFFATAAEQFVSGDEGQELEELREEASMAVAEQGVDRDHTSDEQEEWKENYLRDLLKRKAPDVMSSNRTGDVADKMKFDLSDGPPVRLCCGRRHAGPVCGDGKVWCCLCFRRVEQSNLNVTPDGQKEDVCLKCAQAEQAVMKADVEAPAAVPVDLGTALQYADFPPPSTDAASREALTILAAWYRAKDVDCSRLLEETMEAETELRALRINKPTQSPND